MCLSHQTFRGRQSSATEREAAAAAVRRGLHKEPGVHLLLLPMGATGQGSGVRGRCKVDSRVWMSERCSNQCGNRRQKQPHPRSSEQAKVSTRRWWRPSPSSAEPPGEQRCFQGRFSSSAETQESLLSANRRSRKDEEKNVSYSCCVCVHAHVPAPVCKTTFHPFLQRQTRAQ